MLLLWTDQEQMGQWSSEEKEDKERLSFAMFGLD